MPPDAQPVLDYAPAPESTGWQLLRALRSRNYRLFFIGQGISLIGTWLTKVAMSWLVYQLAKGPGEATPTDVAKAAALLGLVNFVANVPMFVFGPFGGVIVDRFSRHRVLILTQVLAMAQSGVLAYLTLSHLITIPMVIGLALFQGMVDALDTPARQAFTVELVDDPVDLANAIALNSSCFNAARLLGPAIGGLLLVKFSAGVCFAIDSVSYIAVVIGLLMMSIVSKPRSRAGKNVFSDLKEGFKYTFGFPPVRAILVLVGITAFTGTAFGTLMPLFADAMSNGPSSATRFGLLVASIGAGAFCGAVYLASRRTVVGLGSVMCVAALMLALSMSAFALMHNFYFGLLLCAGAGFGMVTHFASGNTMLQTITEDAMRGRVMSFFSMAVIGMAPFGSLLAGWLSARFHSPTPVVLIYAAFMLASTLLFFRNLPAMRKLVRPIYIKKGIIPEVAVALEMEEREER